MMIEKYLSHLLVILLNDVKKLLHKGEITCITLLNKTLHTLLHNMYHQFCYITQSIKMFRVHENSFPSEIVNISLVNCNGKFLIALEHYVLCL
jgi:hypothetical protein